MTPRFSIIIPYYDGLAHIEEAVQSVLGQGRDDVEVIVVDDRDPGLTGDALDTMFPNAPQVKVVHRSQNGGTLRARRDGVLASAGDSVLLLDQDDALAEGSLAAIDGALADSPVDILHFGARVVAETGDAAAARDGMESFLTPPARELAGDEILVRQFAFEDGFDWHVHHKAYRGDFARACWGRAADVELTLSDDLYLSFILSSSAKTYRAVGEAWYVYHLGRGETMAGNYTVDKLARVSRLDSRALSLLCDYVARPDVASARSDWAARLADVRDHLIEHVANEMADGLSLSECPGAIERIEGDWEPDALAGELWRFVRDRAYALYNSGAYPKKDDDLYALLDQVEAVDAHVCGEGSERYRFMRDAARRHLADIETIAPASRKLWRKLVQRVCG
ncbi:glycosyltransferase family 2 protein [Paratractidigestivibacter sp.]|uniref:glycosyltransferase family 2 protein n=1 Tax=Paratractidigestivibacter sp. TaxID=2847316 RepID=UPI002ACB10E9|nr:glycosyltransferase [Paratractidigestivibacter sp.]